jgi:hypothetical protein
MLIIPVFRTHVLVVGDWFSADVLGVWWLVQDWVLFDFHLNSAFLGHMRTVPSSGARNRGMKRYTTVSHSTTIEAVIEVIHRPPPDSAQSARAATASLSLDQMFRTGLTYHFPINSVILAVFVLEITVQKLKKQSQNALQRMLRHQMCAVIQSVRHDRSIRSPYGANNKR